MSEQMIGVNDYLEHSGKLKSLAYVGADGKKRTNGSALPGLKFTGTLEEKEMIICTDGVLLSNSQTLKAGDRIVVEVGETIDFQVVEPASYVCIYG